MVDLPVGIVGASAAGLALACGLARFGVGCRLYEARPEPAGDGRPTTLGSRSLEGLDRFGALADVLTRGRAVRRTRILYRGATLGYLPTSEIASRYPFLLSLTRGALREGLEAAAARTGRVVLDRGLRVVGVRAGADGAEVLGEDGRVRRHRFLAAAADGARRLLGVPLEGEAVSLPRWVGSGPFSKEEFDLYLGPSGMARSYPGSGRVAAEGWVRRRAGGPPALEALREELRLPGGWTFEPEPDPGPGRVAPFLRVGPVFLLGPAARLRLHGGWRASDLDVAEAENLAWKLAAVLQGAPEDLLESYAGERLPAAGAFADPASGFLPRVCEERVMEFLGPLLRAAFVRKALGESAAGLRARYAPSPWCRHDGALPRSARPGTRLPEVRYEDPEGRRRWLQERLGSRPMVLRFGEDGPGLRVSRRERGPEVLHDPDGSVHRALGGRRGGVLVVRPDGVVGYRAWPERRERTQEYLARVAPPGGMP